MTDLVQQIEQMRLRMNELVTEEHGFVRSLANTLADADQNLLEAVRNVAAEHEGRRGEILRELQLLATRMFMMPKPAPLTALANVMASALVNSSKEQPPCTAQPIARDWRRQLAANFREELAFHLKVLSSHAPKSAEPL